MLQLDPDIYAVTRIYQLCSINVINYYALTTKDTSLTTIGLTIRTHTNATGIANI